VCEFNRSVEFIINPKHKILRHHDVVSGCTPKIKSSIVVRGRSCVAEEYTSKAFGTIVCHANVGININFDDKFFIAGKNEM